MGRVFISYARKDGADNARELNNELLGVGHQVFLDSKNIPGAVEWEREIRRRIRWSDLLVIVNTPYSIRSKWVYKEFEEAQKRRKAILPVTIDGSEIAPYLARYQAFDIPNGDNSRVVFEIDRLLRRLFIQKLIFRGLTFIAVIAITTIGVFVINKFTSQVPTTPIAQLSTDTSTPPPASNTPTPTNTPNPTQTPNPPAATPIFGPLLLAENFESARIPDNWIQDGQWAVVSDGSTAALQAIGRSTVQFGDEQWVNYRMEVDIRVANLGEANSTWIDVRALHSLDRFMIVTLDFKSNYLILIAQKDFGDVKELARTPLAFTSLAFRENEWFKVTIEVNEQRIAVYLNGVRQMNKQIDSSFGRGAIRLRSFNNNVLFDNIRVSSLENGTN
jgi:TIR domain/Domain of Unknown Function (DUF1080)